MYVAVLLGQCTMKRMGQTKCLQKLLRHGKVRSVKTHNSSKLTIAILTSILFVAKHLLPQKAVLVPQACHAFLEAYGVHCIEDIKSFQLTLEVEESSVQFSSWWLLHQLIFYLDTFVMHKRVHIKFGTVLFWKGGDKLVALSWAFGSSQSPLPSVV